MPKFIVYWDARYGQSSDVIEADTLKEADEYAYEEWLGEAESNADYGAVEYTEENCDEFGEEWEGEEEE